MPKRTKKATTRYDVAISFAGEDRKLAQALAGALRHNKISVFYDDYERAELLGKDLYQHLNAVYRDQARYCVVLVSRSYLKKDWPRHELKGAQARAFRQKKEYILPIKLDQSKLPPGINPTTGYIDAAVTTVSEIVRIIAKKLGVQAADLSKSLRETWDKGFVEYQGARMTSYWPIMIEDAQKATTLTFLSTLGRIRYGKEKRYGRRLPKNCHDCGVIHGQFHVMGCDMEECAQCRGQLISCGCRTTDDDLALTDV